MKTNIIITYRYYYRDPGGLSLGFLDITRNQDRYKCIDFARAHYEIVGSRSH